MTSLYRSMIDCTSATPSITLPLTSLSRVELGLLAEVADGEPRCQPGVAGVAVVEARHDLEQARLARSVRADHADLGARVERQRDVLQHRLVGWIEPGQLVTGVDEFVRHGAREATSGRSIGGVVGQPGRRRDVLGDEHDERRIPDHVVPGPRVERSETGGQSAISCEILGRQAWVTARGRMC